MAAPRSVPRAIRPVVLDVNGRCRACGSVDPRSAVPSCELCAWRRAADAGRKPRALAHELMLPARRRQLSPNCDLVPIKEALQAERVPQGVYQLWVDVDGGVVRQVIPGVDGALPRMQFRRVEDAEAIGRGVVYLFKAVWVVSRAGVWQLNPNDEPLR